MMRHFSLPPLSTLFPVAWAAWIIADSIVIGIEPAKFLAKKDDEP